MRPLAALSYSTAHWPQKLNIILLILSTPRCKAEFFNSGRETIDAKPVRITIFLPEESRGVKKFHCSKNTFYVNIVHVSVSLAINQPCQFNGSQSDWHLGGNIRVKIGPVSSPALSVLVNMCIPYNMKDSGASCLKTPHCAIQVWPSIPS